MPKLNNLTELAEFLKSMNNHHPRMKLGFDMKKAYEFRDFTRHPCGSACCIGGWVQHHNKGTRNMTLEDAVMTIAPAGMSEIEVYRLCYPKGNSRDQKSPWHATPQQAARAIEILRDTGFCDWDRAMNEVPS